MDTTTSVVEPLVTVVRRPDKEVAVVGATVVVAMGEVAVAATEEVVAGVLVEKSKRGLEIGIVNSAGLTISLDARRASSVTSLGATNHKLFCPLPWLNDKRNKYLLSLISCPWILCQLFIMAGANFLTELVLRKRRFSFSILIFLTISHTLYILIFIYVNSCNAIF